MPTAMHWYHMAAKKYGKVDPMDEEAVSDFFVHRFRELPERTQQAVTRFLLGAEIKFKKGRVSGPRKIPKNCKCPACVKHRVAFPGLYKKENKK